MKRFFSKEGEDLGKIIIFMLSVFAICGCANEADEAVIFKNLKQRQDILVDKETGIQYIIISKGAYEQCVTVRLNSDGKPMIDKKWKLENKK